MGKLGVVELRVGFVCVCISRHRHRATEQMTQPWCNCEACSVSAVIAPHARVVDSASTLCPSAPVAPRVSLFLSARNETTLASAVSSYNLRNDLAYTSSISARRFRKCAASSPWRALSSRRSRSISRCSKETSVLGVADCFAFCPGLALSRCCCPDVSSSPYSSGAV